MSADLIATQVAKLLKGDIRRPTVPDNDEDPEDTLDIARELMTYARDMFKGAPVIDITAINRSIMGKNFEIYDNCVAPTFETAIFAWVNSYQNILLACFDSELHDGGAEPKWQTAEQVDWTQVKWIENAVVFAASATVPLFGPLCLWRYAVMPDGYPADMHYVLFHKWLDVEQSATLAAAVLAAMNFLNCRNIELVEPQRSRAERRRIERADVVIKEINVMPIGKTTRRRDGDPSPGSVPLTSVRGHFASYGPAYNRKLLFGKYEGRFWIPQHARGTEEAGINRNDYKLRSE